MFYKALLKDSFDKLMNKAIEDCVKQNYEDKEYEIGIIERSMQSLLCDLLDSKINELKKRGNLTAEVLDKRKKKIEKVLSSLLDKRIEKMKRDLT